MEENQIKSLNNLIVFQKAKEYGQIAWNIYQSLDWQQRKTTGDQMIRSVDSVGANIVEGYGRYHYLEKIKFYYISRASLMESKFWIDLLFERNLIAKEIYIQAISLYEDIIKLLNGLIKSVYKSKQEESE